MTARSLPTPPAQAMQPLMAGFLGAVGSAVKGGEGGAVDFELLFREAGTAKTQCIVVLRALAEKLARALSIPADDIDATRSLSEYGADSLMAVELRNLIRRSFVANVAVFDIMGGLPIVDVAGVVVAKSEIGKTR